MADGDRRFGEEGGRLSYGSYLRIPEVLDQQVPISDPPAHDELLFITIHQARTTCPGCACIARTR